MRVTIESEVYLSGDSRPTIAELLSGSTYGEVYLSGDSRPTIASRQRAYARI